MSVGKLYMLDISPPCRAVMITAKALGIELECIEVDLMNREHLAPEFLKMNPAHSVPTYLDNDGTAMGDSHSIMAFLVGKYGKPDDSLYPKDLAKRAAVDQRLHFDSGAVYSSHIDIVVPLWMREFDGISKKQRTWADSVYDILNAFLEGNNWVAKTDSPTIADFSLATSVMSYNVVVPMDVNKCGNIVAWLKRCEALPFFKAINQKGRDSYNHILALMLKNDYSFMPEAAQK